MSEARCLTKTFGAVTAAKDLSFQVQKEKGEIFGLLGSNGDGKTNTPRMLCCLIPPTSVVP